MSNNVLNAVWKHSHARGVNRLLLIAMADSASDEGRAWGKIETWADKVFTHERSVQYQVSKLVALGELVVTGEYGRSKSLHFWIPLLPGEEGYNPQPCTEKHRCNKNHTSLAVTMEFRTRSKRAKRVQGSAPIPAQKGATSFTHSQTAQEKGAKNGTKRVQDFAERVQDFVNGEGVSAEQDGRDANRTIYEPYIEPTAAAIDNHYSREAKEAAAAAWNDNTLRQTAEQIRQRLAMPLRNLDGLVDILRQYPEASQYFIAQAAACADKLRVRPLRLSHFAEWIRREFARRAEQETTYEQSASQQQAPTAERGPRPSTEDLARDEQKKQQFMADVAALFAEAEQRGAGTLPPMSRDAGRRKM